MKFFVLFFLVVIAVVSSKRPRSDADREVALSFLRTEKGMLEAFGQGKKKQADLIHKLFEKKNKRQFGDCNTDNFDEIVQCEDCALTGQFVNRTAILTDVGEGEDTNDGRVVLLSILSLTYGSDNRYELTSRLQLIIDDLVADLVNVAQDVLCGDSEPTDVTEDEPIFDLILKINGGYGSEEECRVDTCEFACELVDISSQQICGNELTTEGFIEFVKDLSDDLGFDLDTDILKEFEDSDFLSDLISLDTDNPCAELETAYPVNFEMGFGPEGWIDDDDGEFCDRIFFTALPDTGFVRQAGGQMVASLGLVVLAVVFSLLGQF